MLDFAELIAAHKAQLGRMVERFREADDADFARHLQLAARRLDARWPRVQPATLTVTAAVNEYPAPAGCQTVLSHSWGRGHRPTPWDETAPGPPPLLSLLYNAGGRVLWLEPAPTWTQIVVWGAEFPYRYQVAHGITETEVTVDEDRRADVLLAALIEALRDLSAETALVQLQKGLAGLPNAGSPAYLYAAALQEWDRR